MNEWMNEWELQRLSLPLWASKPSFLSCLNSFPGHSRSLWFLLIHISITCFVPQKWRRVLALWFWFWLWIVFNWGGGQRGTKVVDHSVKNLTLYNLAPRYLNQNTGLPYRLIWEIGPSITTNKIRNKTLSSKKKIKGENSRNWFLNLEYQHVIWHIKLSHDPLYPKSGCKFPNLFCVTQELPEDTCSWWWQLVPQPLARLFLSLHPLPFNLQPEASSALATPALLRFWVTGPSFLSYELLSRVLWIPFQPLGWPHQLPSCENTNSSCCLYTRMIIVSSNLHWGTSTSLLTWSGP